MPQRDSLGFTLLVAVVLCVVCSLAVSAAAVALRPLQEQNKILDRQRNILDAAGLPMGEYGKTASSLPNDQIEEMYKGWVSEKLVNLDDGTYNTEEDPETYDEFTRRIQIQGWQRSDRQLRIPDWGAQP